MYASALLERMMNADTGISSLYETAAYFTYSQQNYRVGDELIPTRAQIRTATAATLDDNSLVLDRFVETTRFDSSTSAMKRTPEFAALVEYGENTVLRVMERLSRGDNQIQYFLLLASITGENPVLMESRGIVKEMALDWLSWGRRTGRLDSNRERAVSEPKYSKFLADERRNIGI